MRKSLSSLQAAYQPKKGVSTKKGRGSAIIERQPLRVFWKILRPVSVKILYKMCHLTLHRGSREHQSRCKRLLPCWVHRTYTRSYLVDICREKWVADDQSWSLWRQQISLWQVCQTGTHLQTIILQPSVYFSFEGRWKMRSSRNLFATSRFVSTIMRLFSNKNLTTCAHTLWIIAFLKNGK